MSDGPFKNLKLDSRLKRFASAVQNDTVDDKQRTALASDAIIHAVLKESPTLFSDLTAYLESDQLDFDPKATINAIFEGNPKSQFTDNFQKEVRLGLHDGKPPSVAISDGLESAVCTQIEEVRTRTQEACLEAHNSGDMWKEQFDRTISGTKAALRDVDVPQIRDALMRGDKNAFKSVIKKKEGLNEGPPQ